MMKLCVLTLAALAAYASASSDTMVPEEDFLMTPVDQEDDLSMAPALTMAELEETLDGASDAEVFAGLAMLQMVVDHPEEAHNSPELAKLSKSHFKWIKKSAQGLAKQISMSKDEEGADLMQEQWGVGKKAWNRAKNKARKVCRSSVDKGASSIIDKLLKHATKLFSKLCLKAAAKA